MSIKGIAFTYSFDRLFKPSNVLFCRCGKATQFFQILRNGKNIVCNRLHFTHFQEAPYLEFQLSNQRYRIASKNCI